MYRMSQDARKGIEHIVGFSALTPEEERAHIKKISNEDLHFSTRFRKSIYGRGNPLLARKKYRAMEYVDDKISDIIKKKGSSE